MSIDENSSPARRSFIGSVAVGTLALVSAPLQSISADTVPEQDDPWLQALKGKHKQVFDAATLNSGFAFAFASNYVRTMTEHYKLAAGDVTAFVVARFTGTGLALTDAIWKKYALGKLWNITDPATKAPAERNLFYMSKPGDMANIDASADKFIARGGVVVVCGLALRVWSNATAAAAGVTPAVAFAEFTAGVIPGAHIAPSGVLAIAKAQEAGATYCYGG